MKKRAERILKIKINRPRVVHIASRVDTVRRLPPGAESGWRCTRRWLYVVCTKKSIKRNNCAKGIVIMDDYAMGSTGATLSLLIASIYKFGI